jgi:hypothetical protein
MQDAGSDRRRCREARLRRRNSQRRVILCKNRFRMRFELDLSFDVGPRGSDLLLPRSDLIRFPSKNRINAVTHFKM